MEINKDFSIICSETSDGGYKAQLFRTAKKDGNTILSESKLLYVSETYHTKEQAESDAESYYHHNYE